MLFSLLLIIIIVLLLVTGTNEKPPFYSYSFIDNFNNATKINFGENLILANYLPADKDNSFFQDIYKVLVRPSTSETVYINQNGNIIQDEKIVIRNSITSFDLYAREKKPVSYSLIFKQNGANEYWMINISINKRFTIDLYRQTLKKLKKLYKYSGDMPKDRHLIFDFFSIENRLFAYHGNKILFSFINEGLTSSGYYSFTENTKSVQNKYIIKMGTLKSGTLEKTPYYLIPKEETFFNFNKEGYDRLYKTLSVNSTEKYSTYLRRIKCLELPSKIDHPYLTVTKPSIIFPLNASAEYYVELPPKAVMKFSLALLNENYYDNYRARFIISIKPDNTEKAKIFNYKFKYNNGTFNNYTIDLGKYSGKKCKIVLKLEDSQKLKYSFPGEILVALGAPKIHSKATETKKNVILISLDTLRQDHLSCYGYHRNTSPNIDEFAQNAMVFDSAVSNSNSTLPSHMSMFTSLYPAESGFLFGLNDMFMENNLPDEIKLLGEYMNEIGLRTGAITGGNWVSSWVGYDRGFDSFIEWLGKDIVITVDRAIEWLEDNKDNNFFLFLHTYEIHKPYSRSFYIDKINSPSAKQATIKDRMIARYDSGIRTADEHIGRLIQWLKTNNLFNNTLIIITSDHGENFDHNDKADNLPGTHGKTLYDSEIKIPLLISGAPDFCKKGRYAMQVSNVDILPTILDYYNIQLPDKLRGNNLLKIIRQKNMDNRVAYSEYVILQNKRYCNRSLRTTKNKLIQIERIKQKTTYEFFDLQKDKNERNNLIKKEVKQSKIFIQKLLSLISSMNIPDKEVSRLHNLQKGRFKELQDQLHALGYLR